MYTYIYVRGNGLGYVRTYSSSTHARQPRPTLCISNELAVMIRRPALGPVRLLSVTCRGVLELTDEQVSAYIRAHKRKRSDRRVRATPRQHRAPIITFFHCAHVRNIVTGTVTKFRSLLNY